MRPTPALIGMGILVAALLLIPSPPRRPRPPLPALSDGRTLDPLTWEIVFHEDGTFSERPLY